MATSQVRQTAGELSAQDRALIQLSEEAIRDGLQLREWIRSGGPDSAMFPLNLRKQYSLPNRAEGYFSTLQINGKPISVMGCRQEIEFAKQCVSADALRNFVLAEFLPRSHWTYPNGWPGGFTIEQTVYKSASGEYSKFVGDTCTGCVDWRKLGAEYQWVMLTVNIHDFVMDFGPFRKRFKEAACVVANPGFVHVAENPAPDVALEIGIGYPFVAFAPIPNVFGFGPGKFGTAVKLFTFYLMRDSSIRARLDFAAAPRCAKVFDFGKSIPDPVYGSAGLFSRLLLGLWKPDKFHNKLDTGMLEQHCRVHQAFMDGVANIWREVVAGGSK